MLMLVRIFMGLVMTGLGAFAFYTTLPKAQQVWPDALFDQAIGIPKIVTRVVRGVLGLLFIIMGIVTILRAVGLLS
jgi:hypothetical protein